jgi:hypothetical protein
MLNLHDSVFKVERQDFNILKRLNSIKIIKIIDI